MAGFLFIPILLTIMVFQGFGYRQDIRARTDDGRKVILKSNGTTKGRVITGVQNRFWRYGICRKIPELKLIAACGGEPPQRFIYLPDNTLYFIASA